MNFGHTSMQRLWGFTLVHLDRNFWGVGYVQAVKQKCRVFGNA